MDKEDVIWDNLQEEDEEVTKIKQSKTTASLATADV